MTELGKAMEESMASRKKQGRNNKRAVWRYQCNFAVMDGRMYMLVQMHVSACVFLYMTNHTDTYTQKHIPVHTYKYLYLIAAGRQASRQAG